MDLFKKKCFIKLPVDLFALQYSVKSGAQFFQTLGSQENGFAFRAVYKYTLNPGRMMNIINIFIFWAFSSVNLSQEIRDGIESGCFKSFQPLGRNPEFRFNPLRQWKKAEADLIRLDLGDKAKLFKIIMKGRSQKD